jgi:hypothetical protein
MNSQSMLESDGPGIEDHVLPLLNAGHDKFSARKASWTRRQIRTVIIEEACSEGEGFEWTFPSLGKTWGPN